MQELDLFVTKTARELEEIERSVKLFREQTLENLGRILSRSTVESESTETENESGDVDGAGELVEAYGALAARWLMPEHGRIEILSRTMIDLFYSTLMMRPEARAILDYLSTQEIENLKSAQIFYLTAVLSPDLSKPQHERLARETGNRHAMVGLDPATLAEAFSLYRHELERFFPTASRRDSLLRGIITERLANDLSWQLVAFSEIEQERARLTDDFLHLFSTAANRRDLLKGVLDRILQIPGVVGASVARILEGNRIQCEVLSGLVLNASECLREESFQKKERNSLARKAFERERPIFQNTFLDASFDSIETEEAKLLGIRSMAAWPLLSQDNVPIDILNIYSHWPGYFHSASQQFFWTILSRSLGSALGTLEKQPRTTDARSVSDNQRYRRLLQEGKIEMWYQPVINSYNRELVKFESLARLRDGDRVYTPGQFLPAFGTNHLLQLFDRGFDRIREDLSIWGGIPGAFFASPHLSINLPVEAFSSRSFIDRLSKMPLAGEPSGRSGRPLELTLELVEAGFLDERSAKNQIDILKEAGFRIALDDIGTGDSSIRRLKSLPIDEIKIDKSFIRSLDKNLDHLGFVFSLIDLASGLGINYVLEGVENPLIYDIVSMTGARGMLQGYEIGRPMPASEVASWWDKWKSAPVQDHPWSLPGWLVQKEIRLRYSVILFSRGAYELIDMSSFLDVGRCPLSDALSKLRIPDDLKQKVDRLHREFHQVMKEDVLKNRPLNHPEVFPAFEGAWRHFQSALIDLMAQNR